MDWFYTAGTGNQQGPIPEEELSKLVKNGSVKLTELAWKEGMENWLPISQIPTLTGEPPALPTPTYANAVGPPITQHVPNYLWQSIVCLLACFWPTAIPAIVYATRVEPALRMGNLPEALQASAEAKKWCWISFWIPAGFILIGIIVFILIAIMGAGAAAIEAA